MFETVYVVDVYFFILLLISVLLLKMDISACPLKSKDSFFVLKNMNVSPDKQLHIHIFSIYVCSLIKIIYIRLFLITKFSFS